MTDFTLTCEGLWAQCAGTAARAMRLDEAARDALFEDMQSGLLQLGALPSTPIEQDDAYVRAWLTTHATFIWERTLDAPPTVRSPHSENIARDDWLDAFTEHTPHPKCRRAVIFTIAAQSTDDSPSAREITSEVSTLAEEQYSARRLRDGIGRRN